MINIHQSVSKYLLQSNAIKLEPANFTYGFPVAIENFAKAGCEFHTLTDYNELLQLALESGYIQNEQLDLLRKWREAPEKFNDYLW